MNGYNYSNIYFLPSQPLWTAIKGEYLIFTVVKYKTKFDRRQPSSRNFSSNVKKSSGRGVSNSKYSPVLG